MRAAREDPEFWDEQDPFDDAQRRRDIITYGNVTVPEFQAVVAAQVKADERRAEIIYDPEYDFEGEDG
jgi:hypothetical protein